MAVFIIVVASHLLALVMITAEHQYDDNGTQSQRCSLATPKTALVKRASGSSTCARIASHLRAPLPLAWLM